MELLGLKTLIGVELLGLRKIAESGRACSPELGDGLKKLAAGDVDWNAPAPNFNAAKNTQTLPQVPKQVQPPMQQNATRIPMTFVSPSSNQWIGLNGYSNIGNPPRLMPQTPPKPYPQNLVNPSSLFFDGTFALQRGQFIPKNEMVEAANGILEATRQAYPNKTLPTMYTSNVLKPNIPVSPANLWFGGRLASFIGSENNSFDNPTIKGNVLHTGFLSPSLFGLNNSITMDAEDPVYTNIHEMGHHVLPYKQQLPSKSLHFITSSVGRLFGTHPLTYQQRKILNEIAAWEAGRPILQKMMENPQFKDRLSIEEYNRVRSKNLGTYFNND